MEARGPNLAHLPSPQGPRPHTPASRANRALTPPCSAPWYAPRAGWGGSWGGSRVGATASLDTRTASPARGDSMGRRCWRRRVLAAVCLGASLLFLWLAPSALRLGECPLGRRRVGGAPSAAGPLGAGGTPAVCARAAGEG